MMTQNEVLAELRKVIADNQQFTTWTISTPHIVELVNWAIKQEREACAKVCEEMRPSKPAYDQRFYDGCTFSAAAIRARDTHANN
jgi:hypothetical protein